MKRNSLVLLGITLVCSLLCLSCRNGTPKKTTEVGDEEITEEGSSDLSEQQTVTFDASSLMVNKSDKSILYLDCSKSMAGYIEAKNSSVFNNVIAGLLYRSEATSAHLFDLQEQTEVGREDFINMVNNKRIRWSSESNLGKMISAMADNFVSGRANISYLISDGIMSGSDAQIRADREYNKTHYGYSQEEIESALRKCGPDAAILVVRYISGFSTNSVKQFYYYCYDNSHVELNDLQRPFFFIALGTLNSIKSLFDDVKSNARLSGYTNSLLLGDNMPYQVDFRPAYNRGASMKDGVYTIDKTVKSSEPVFFNINLSSIQDYMKDEEYIKQNGSLFSKSVNGSWFEVSQGNYETSLANGILTLSIQSEKLRGATLSYKIRYSLPNWVNVTTSLDDKNVATDFSPKTFNLRYFIEALAVVNKSHLSPEGYINQTEDVRFK